MTESIDELLDYVSDRLDLGMYSVPDDHCARGDDILEPPSGNLDCEFEGFKSNDSQDYYRSLYSRGHYEPQNINVPVETQNTRPK